MMTRGIKSEEVDIHHMGQPCEGVPVGLAFPCRVKCPYQILNGQTLPDGFIFIHIGIVIKIDEFKLIDPGVKGEGNCGKGKEKEQRF